MPFPGESMLLQWTGQWANTTEQFVGSMRFAPDSQTGNLLDAVDNDEAFDDVLADLRKFWTNPASKISGYAIIRMAKWNRIGVDGKYKNPTTRVRTELSIPGTVVGRLPLQCAWVMSWKTGISRGAARSGRTYWPAVPTLGDDFLADRAQCLAAATAGATLIDDWGNWPGLDVTSTKPVVSSSGIPSAPSGAFRPITSVRVGTRMDIQRRRANSQPESFQTAVVGA